MLYTKIFKMTKTLPHSLATLLMFIFFMSACKPVAAQQRSAYDLAAWIIAAVDTYDTTTVNWALKEGGQIDYKRAGMNALETAIFDRKTAMVKFLLQKGARVEYVKQDGMNALQYAEMRGNPEIIELIRKNMPVSVSKPASPVIIKTMPEVKKEKVGIPVPTSAVYAVGDVVLHSRDRGKTWEPGYIKEISTNQRLLADGISPYLVENKAKTSQNYLDLNFITTFTRQPSWTSFFVGEWGLYLPIAATERIIDRDVYQIISGGDKLHPLRIKPNKTYTWVIDKNKTINGQWIQNENSPGIVLLNGYRGINWQVYNSTDNDNRKIFKTDYIIIADTKGNNIANHGFRIIRK